MKNTEEFLVLYLLLVLFSADVAMEDKAITAFLTNNIEGYRLDGFVVLEQKRASILECAMLCQRESSVCKSINFQHVSGKKRHTCQINKENMRAKEALMKRVDGFQYWETVEPLMCADTCRGFTTCRNGGTCEAKTRLCQCQAHVNGDHCERVKVSGHFVVDDVGDIVVDGKNIGRATVYDDSKYFEGIFATRYREIVIQATNTGGNGGLIASFNDGLYTNTSWQCRRREDAEWSTAVSHGRNDDVGSVYYQLYNRPKSNIPNGALWIWTANMLDSNVDCRIRR